MRYESHDDVLTNKGKLRTIKTLEWWCTKCDEAILTGDPLVAHEKALQFKAEVDGVLNATVKAEGHESRARLDEAQSEADVCRLRGGGGTKTLPGASNILHEAGRSRRNRGERRG